jgi:hypothetical protein
MALDTRSFRRMASKNYEVTDLGTSSMLRRAPIVASGC